MPRYVGHPETSTLSVSFNNLTLLVIHAMYECSPWRAARHHKAESPLMKREHSPGSPGTARTGRCRGLGGGGGGGWAPAESGAPTTQSVMESDPPLSAVRLPTACANTLPSINTVTRHTHAPLYKCTLTRWPSHTGDLVSAAAHLPGNKLYKQGATAF